MADVLREEAQRSMAMFGCVPVRGHYAEKGEAVVYFAGGNDLSSFFFLSFSFFPFFWGGGGGGHAGNLQRTLRPDVLSKLACKGEDQACHPGCGEKAWPEEGLFCVDLGAEGGEDASCSADTGLQAGVELRG